MTQFTPEIAGLVREYEDFEEYVVGFLGELDATPRGGAMMVDRFKIDNPGAVEEVFEGDTKSIIFEGDIDLSFIAARLGFTWEDVDALRELSGLADIHLGIERGRVGWEIADRVASLLPPRDPEDA